MHVKDKTGENLIFTVFYEDILTSTNDVIC